MNSKITTMLALISVVIPTDRSAAFIRETVASIHAQLHPRIETILVDDGSPDDTVPSLSSPGSI